MEQKCLKTSIYINDTIFNEATEQAVDVDFTLPDYCPDISKIFKCQAVPRIASKGINGRTITIDGAVHITLLYADRDGKLCSYEYQYPFSKSLEMSSECAGANLCCKIRNEYINCRAVTGRKVDIHGAVGIYVKVFKRKCTDIVSDYDDSNIELRRGMAPATVPMGYSEKYLMIEEEIRIGDSQPNIRNILRCEANPQVKETKIINDKAVVKGEMNLCIIYCPENEGNPQCVKTIIPFSQIIDIDGITELCECETKSQLAFLEVKPRMSSGGENKSFLLTAKLLLTAEAYCSNEIAVIMDAFSRKYKADIKREKVYFEKITHNVNEKYHCKKTVQLEDNISSLIDLWCNVQNVTTKFESGNMVISGTVMAGMIVVNENGNALYCEKPIDFEYKYQLECKLGSPHAEPQIEILSSSYTITSADSIEIRMDMAINTAVYEKCEVSLISDMAIDENETVAKKTKGAMTIYFPSNHECVWDIARIYNASVEEIMRINELESEQLTAGKMILVPVM